MLNIPEFAGFEFQRLSGGCINDVYRVWSSTKSYVLKVGSRSSTMFETEAAGLKLLSPHLSVPNVIKYGEFENQSFIILQDLGNGHRKGNKNAMSSLGTELAKLHLNAKAQDFGLDHDNWIGSLPQRNTWCTSWPVFFENYRIRPLVQSAFEANKLTSSDLELLTVSMSFFRNCFPMKLHHCFTVIYGLGMFMTPIL
ncbi:hypothetical protein GEMRC1_004730 [Eukaryota sp. GEM-RC1]